ncbi:cupin domain-containing protein [Massilia pseudoviolaceinigra]|uniref:cupin domain-containing protein n=1 Tax=Massilia pseudoviolaceinigra TaxID=3057165 RepID=UPI002796C367|nr:cupin domain-containing protein [Massilia sp. CCM 9206]MDQ1920354.1 cupin domain-containing protein [Massilia sp. CCM 9206]
MSFIMKIALSAVSLALMSAPVMAQPAAGASVQVAAAPLPAPQFDAKGIARTETVRSQFDNKREAIQVRVDFAPGASFPKHSHPGVEIAYVLSGSIEYELNGKTVRLQAGESIYIPAGAVHSAKNTGTGITSELATYLVEKNQPIVILDK